jgi:hypothetical protein
MKLIAFKSKDSQLLNSIKMEAKELLWIMKEIGRLFVNNLFRDEAGFLKFLK